MGMPLRVQDKDDIYRRLKENWRIDDGNYLATIEDIHMKEIPDGRKPLQWDLRIDDQRTLEKLHWIDSKGGTSLLIHDLKSIGIETTAIHAFNTLNSLIGKRIRVHVEYNGEHQNIFFLEMME